MDTARYALKKENALFLLVLIDSGLIQLGKSAVMCKKYGGDTACIWTEVFFDDYETLKSAEYKTFELWK